MIGNNASLVTTATATALFKWLSVPLIPCAEIPDQCQRKKKKHWWDTQQWLNTDHWQYVAVCQGPTRDH